MLPIDFSATEKPAQVQENLIAYYRLFAGLPGMLMKDDAETFWFLSRKPAPGDMVLRARWAGEGERIEARIDSLFAQIGQHRDRIDWFVFPGDLPPDLNSRLERRGMPGGPGGNWLWADLASLGDSPIAPGVAPIAPGVAPSAPGGFHIAQVRDDRQMAEWIRVSELGFEHEELRDYYAAYTRHGYGPQAYSLHYIGDLDDNPVTSGTLLEAGGCASIYDLSTPPAYRRQGFGSLLMRALMDEIRSRGYPDTWIWSSNIGKSVYQKLGYIECDFGLREHTWKKG